VVATGSRCFVPDRIAPVLPIVLAIVQVIASAIGQGIVAATDRARRIAPKAAAIAPRPPIAAAAPHAGIAEAVAAGP
jgi:hypothetical protein